ncbi:hypothetical protein McanMca71_003023 [Microsporum canis]|uniref:ORP1 n=1 Tax=Arthroderma otae (strain ATCC MYA-4605 / CBS 113480) TaxID=554155 RepID=C5G0B5_ARTOC|nr:conserved hypothetical protein [Microsporum canis CBS 113480]EEQ35568.1 conserved hypothetical protein [Microsporum canis CBS 113480]
MAQQCQFDESCSTGSSHYRKVISHIFGRNKKCTVNVPDSVWIYYCRKHYQRARYRNDEWPFTQCRLAIDTIRNMRAWGGVESFDLALRRRETIAGQTATSTSTSTATSTSATSTSTATSTSAATSTSTKRSPKSIPRPVPAWLHGCVGSSKSFDEILRVLNDLRAYFLELTAANQEAFFPDIEILPNLRRQSSKSSQQPRLPASRKGAVGSRVTSKGAVAKVEK